MPGVRQWTQLHSGFGEVEKSEGIKEGLESGP